MAPYFPGTALYPGTALWPEYNGEVQPVVTASTAVLTGNSVAFSGTVVPKSDLRTYWYFEWGQKGSGAFGSSSPVVPGNAGTAGTATVSHTQENFPGGDYQYRLTAWNGAGTGTATAGTFLLPDLVSGYIQTNGAATDDYYPPISNTDRRVGTVLLSGDAWSSHHAPISELAFRRSFIHEAQRVQ